MNPFFVCPICRAVVNEPGEVCHRCQSKAESAMVVRVCGWLLVLCFVIAAISARSCKGAELITYSVHQVGPHSWKLGHPTATNLFYWGEPTITREFLHRVALMESGGNAKARGKAGELGRFQLKACAVEEVNRIEGTKWQHRHALDPELAEYIAYAYLRICQRRSDGTADGAYRIYRGLR